VHLVDITQDDPVAAYRTVRHELESYGEELAAKPELVGLNKIDALPAEEAERIRDEFASAIGKETRLVSGVSGAGVRELVNEIAAMLRARRQDEPEETQPEQDWAP
jgi:GTP-binding protein